MPKVRFCARSADYDDAIPEYETVLALDRNSVRAYAHIGQCKLYTGSLEEVIPLEEKAIQLSPRDPEVDQFLSPHWAGTSAAITHR